MYVFKSISAKTGLAPVYKIAFPDAINVNGVVITSSPSPIPQESSATCNAAVPELTAIPYLPWQRMLLAVAGIN